MWYELAISGAAIIFYVSFVETAIYLIASLVLPAAIWTVWTKWEEHGRPPFCLDEVIHYVNQTVYHHDIDGTGFIECIRGLDIKQLNYLLDYLQNN